MHIQTRLSRQGLSEGNRWLLLLPPWNWDSLSGLAVSEPNDQNRERRICPAPSQHRWMSRRPWQRQAFSLTMMSCTGRLSSEKGSTTHGCFWESSSESKHHARLCNRATVSASLEASSSWSSSFLCGLTSVTAGNLTRRVSDRFSAMLVASALCPSRPRCQAITTTSESRGSGVEGFRCGCWRMSNSISTLSASRWLQCRMYTSKWIQT